MTGNLLSSTGGPREEDNCLRYSRALI